MDKEPRLHLDDDDMSLQSKLVGGGRDLGEESSKEETRLCPACGRVTTFIQGKCSNCDFKPGSGDIPAFEQPYMVQSSGNFGRILVGVLLIVLIAVAGYFIYKAVASKPAPDGAAPPSENAQATTPVTEQPGEQVQSHPGSLSAITIDDAFRTKLKELLIKANADWKAAGTASYIYRFSVYEKTIPATSQTITVSLFAGGDQAQDGIAIPKNSPLTKNIEPYIAELNGNAGVNASFQTYATDGDEPPLATDVYVVYGYYYGKEHMNDLKPVIAGLENYNKDKGQYPSALDQYITQPPIRTNGGFRFTENGYGYLPVYQTDGSGNVVMGDGGGVASMMPKSIVGYYLFRYLSSPNDGLDLFSSKDERYYIDKISALPYAPTEPLRNVGLHPDAKPDGIACYVKNGELQR